MAAWGNGVAWCRCDARSLQQLVASLDWLGPPLAIQCEQFCLIPLMLDPDRAMFADSQAMRLPFATLRYHSTKLVQAV